jgi:hypothetical protein
MNSKYLHWFVLSEAFRLLADNRHFICEDKYPEITADQLTEILARGLKTDPRKVRYLSRILLVLLICSVELSLQEYAKVYFTHNVLMTPHSKLIGSEPVRYSSMYMFFQEFFPWHGL